MRAVTLTFVLLIRCRANGHTSNDLNKNSDKQTDFMTALEEKLEMKYQEYVIRAAKWLESVNDRHLGDSELGRLINYNEIKPKLDGSGNRGRGMKKMALGMMPLVFHVGATSTWMLITSLMAAKSVAIGIVLLVFKIAVSSAKVASFFTALKGKQSDHHHHDWSWTPHHEHHGYERSLSAAGAAAHHGSWTSHALEWGSETEYRTLPQEELEGHGESEEHEGHGGHGEPPIHHT